jgi:hypothetical protein
VNELQVNEEDEGFGSTCGNAKAKLLAICSIQTLTAVFPSLLINPLKDVSNFLSNAPQFPKQQCFWKVPWARSFVLLVTAVMQIAGCVWSIGGMIKTGENENPPVSVTHCPPQKSHVLNWDRTRTTAEINQGLNA